MRLSPSVGVVLDDADSSGYSARVERKRKNNDGNDDYIDAIVEEELVIFGRSTRDVDYNENSDEGGIKESFRSEKGNMLNESGKRSSRSVRRTRRGDAKLK